MSRKIRYWLLPVWVLALWLLLVILEPIFGFLDPKEFNSGFLWLFSYIFFLFLPVYLLFLCSCILGLKIFELPRPSNKRFVIAVLAAVCLIPLFFITALGISPFVFMGDYGEQLEPFFSALPNMAVLLAWLIVLRILGLRLPRGKCLFMCFLPVLVFAAVGTALILLSGSGFWFDDYRFDGIEKLTATQWWFYEIARDYFGGLVYCCSYIVISFTVYWTMKYNREQAKLAASLGSPSGRAGTAQP